MRNGRKSTLCGRRHGCRPDDPVGSKPSNQESPNNTQPNNPSDLAPSDTHRLGSVRRRARSRSRTLSSGRGGSTHTSTLGGCSRVGSSGRSHGRVGGTGGFELESLGFGVDVGRVQGVGELLRRSVTALCGEIRRDSIGSSNQTK